MTEEKYFCVPLSPIARQFHLDCARTAINHNTLLYIPDTSSLAIVASIVCVNYYRHFPDSLCFILTDNADAFISTLKDFGVSSGGICVLNNEKKQRQNLPNKGIIIITTRCFVKLCSIGTLKEKDIKLIIIDEADKCYGNKPAARLVRTCYEDHSCFRVVGLTVEMDLKMVTRVQSAISNLNAYKFLVKDPNDPVVGDGLLAEVENIQVRHSSDLIHCHKKWRKGIKILTDELDELMLLNETDPNWLIYSNLDRWRQMAVSKTNMEITELVKRTHILIKSLKHLVLSGRYAFFLYLSAVLQNFPTLAECIAENEHLDIIWKETKLLYDHLEEKNNETKASILRSSNPKFQQLEGSLAGKKGTSASVICWSPFTAKALTVFCQSVFPDRSIHLSTKKSFIEETEYILDSEMLPKYSQLDGEKGVDLLIRTNHVDSNSTRRFITSVALDLISASHVHLEKAVNKILISAHPFETISNRYFSFLPSLGRNKGFDSVAKAFQLEKSEGPLKLSNQFPLEFIPQYSVDEKFEESFQNCSDMFADDVDPFKSTGPLDCSANAMSEYLGQSGDAPHLLSSDDSHDGVRASVKRPADELLQPPRKVFKRTENNED